MIIREENYTSPQSVGGTDKDTKYLLEKNTVSFTPYDSNNYKLQYGDGFIYGMEISPDKRLPEDTYKHRYEMTPDTIDLKLSPHLSMLIEALEITYDEFGETNTHKGVTFNGYRLMFPSVPSSNHSFGNGELRLLLSKGRDDYVFVSLKGSSHLFITDDKLNIGFNLYFTFPYVNPLTGVKEEYTVDVPRDVLDNKENLIVEIKLDGVTKYKFKARFKRKVILSVYDYLRAYSLKEK